MIFDYAKTRKLNRLILIAIGGFIIAMCSIVGIGLRDQIADADLIVVPGNAIKADGTPSPRLKARLDIAIRLFQEHYAPLIFVSGGTGKEGFDEAISMSNYLIKNGVPSVAIVKDGLGNDTAATAKNAATYMHANNLKSALVATQYFHVLRMKLALERNGIQVNGTVHAHYVEMRDLYSIPREVIGYIFYFSTLR